MSENCPKCGSEQSCEPFIRGDYVVLYWKCESADIDGKFVRGDVCRDAQLTALTQRAEQAEAWQNRAIDSAKEIATVECIDGVWWAKCRHGGLYGPQSTEREAWLEVAEMRLTAAEAEVKRLEAKLAQSTNYVADDDTYPHVVWFANGRKVSIASGGHLDVGMEAALLAQPSDGKEATDAQ